MVPKIMTINVHQTQQCILKQTKSKMSHVLSFQ